MTTETHEHRHIYLGDKLRAKLDETQKQEEYPYEHPNRVLAEQWLKDRRQKVFYFDKDLNKWVHLDWNGEAVPSFNPRFEWRVEPYDRHAEMKAKFEANPWMYRWRSYWSDDKTWSEWNYPEGETRPAWVHGADYEIEVIPHWELRKQVAKEPDKWDVEASNDGISWLVINDPAFDEPSLQYRIVPKRERRFIIDQDGVHYDLPEPMREAPEENTQCWVAGGLTGTMTFLFGSSSAMENIWLEAGRLFHTKEDAEAANRIWTAIFGGKENQK